MPSFFANREPCLIGMEAGAGAHFWARKLQAFGHTVKSMAPQYVKPIEENKNDAADAEAICEAGGPADDALRGLDGSATGDPGGAPGAARVGQARTAEANQIRGLLGEFGVVTPQGISHIGKARWTSGGWRERIAGQLVAVADLFA